MGTVKVRGSATSPGPGRKGTDGQQCRRQVCGPHWVRRDTSAAGSCQLSVPAPTRVLSSPGEKAISHTKPASYMSVRCRRADSSLGTAVKWFPSRYLKEKCRVTPSFPQRHVPDFLDCAGSLVYCRVGPALPSRHTARLSFNVHLCDYSAGDVSLHCSAGLHGGRALV